MKHVNCKPVKQNFLKSEAVEVVLQQQQEMVEQLKHQLISCISERDRFKTLAKEFYRRSMQRNDSDVPVSPSTPSLLQCVGLKAEQALTPSKFAEVRQLARIASASPLLSVEEPVVHSNSANDPSLTLSTPVAEHLVEETEHAAVVQELVQSLAASGCRIPSDKLRQFTAELESRSSKADRMKAAVDLLNQSLSKQRQHASQLVQALGRSEENQASLRMALECAIQKADSLSALLRLSESEQLLLLAHCRNIGVVSSEEPFEDQQAQLLRQAVTARKQAEIEAQMVISRLDNSCGMLNVQSGTSSAVGGELLLSSNNASPRTTGTCSSTGTTSSRTTDPSSSVSCHDDSVSGIGSGSPSWTNGDEQRLREYVHQLDRDIQAMQMTINDPLLESQAANRVPTVHDSPLPTTISSTMLSNQSVGSLESAVLVKELATLKEQKAEIKTQCFILANEKKALEAELKARDQQVLILKTQFEQAKVELEEYHLKEKVVEGSGGDQLSPVLNGELAEALMREKRLRVRIQELVDTLEMVGRSAEKQMSDGGVDLVAELRKANSTLSESYEKARKKQDHRIKRLESQLNAVKTRYETKVALLKKQVALLEESTSIGDGRPFAPEVHL